MLKKANKQQVAELYASNYEQWDVDDAAHKGKT